MRDLENTPLARGYATLRDLTPLILEHQATRTIASAWLTKENPRQEISLGDHLLTFEIRRNRRNPSQTADLGYALAIALAPDEYLIAGTDVQVTFTPLADDHSIAGIADASRGTVQNGQWKSERRMSGDDILLEYDLAKAALNRQSGSGLLFGPDGPTLQKVTLYHYR